MGILIRQEKEGKKWVIELRERWVFGDKKKLGACMDTLIQLGIDFKCIPFLSGAWIELEDSNWKTEDYNVFREAWADLIELKRDGVQED